MEEDYNDVDQRNSRKNFLPLHLKLAAIRLYDRNPVYTKVARHLSCPVKYIKQIIDSRDEILKEWKTQNTILNSVCTVQNRANTQRWKQRLDKEMDVWLRDCMGDPNFVATDKLIKVKASQLIKRYYLTNVIAPPNADFIASIQKKYGLNKGKYAPSKDWIASIRKKYGLDKGKYAPNHTFSIEENNNLAGEDHQWDISEQDGRPHILISGKKKPILLNNDKLNGPSSELSKKGHMLKPELLNETMYEWILRMQSRGNGYRIKKDLILHTAQEANKHIKAYNWNPCNAWLKKFRLQYNLEDVNLNGQGLYKLCGERKDQLPLRIPDIIEFVQQKMNPNRYATESQRYRIGYNKSKCGEVVVPVDEGASSPQTSPELGGIIDDVNPVKKVVEIFEDDVPVTCENVIDNIDQQPVTESHRYRIAFSRSMCGEVVVPVDEGAQTCQKLGEIVDDVVPVTCEEVIEIVEQDVPRKCKEVAQNVDSGVPVHCEKVVKIIEDDCIVNTDHQPVPAKRCTNTYSRLKCRSVVSSIVPIKDSCTTHKSMVEVVEIIGDDVPVKCENVAGPAPQRVPCHDVFHIVNAGVAVKSEEIVDNVGHKPVPAKRYKRTYSRLKGRSVVTNILPVKDSCAPQKSMVGAVEIFDDGVTVKNEEVVDDDFSLKIEDIIAGLDPVDDDYVKKEDSHKVKYDEEEYVPRKVKRVERHDSRDTKKFIRSDEDARRYLKALQNFALLQTNFRAIGVLSQLEVIFRNPDLNH